MNDKEKVVNKLLGKCICPKCNKAIDYLKGYEEQGYILEIRDGKEFEGSHEYVEESFNAECPECCEAIFTGYEEAVKFLKEGEK